MATKHVEQYRNGLTGWALCGSGSTEFTSPKNVEECCERCLSIWNREVLPAQGLAAQELSIRQRSSQDIRERLSKFYGWSQS